MKYNFIHYNYDKFENGEHGQIENTLQMKEYQLQTIINSLKLFSRLIRQQGGMCLIITSVLQDYLKIKNSEEFDLGLEYYLDKIWEQHDRNKNLIEHLLQHKQLDDKTMSLLKNTINYFSKTKHFFTKVHEEGGHEGKSRFESTVQYCKEQINYDEKYKLRKEYIDMNREKKEIEDRLREKKSSIMSKLRTLF